MGVNFSLDNKVAIVTGASRGIGEAIAKTFAENGAKVVLASRKQDSLDKVAAAIRESGGEALPIACHTGKMEMIDALYDKVMDTYGKVDILVNNAATNPYFGSALHAPESAYDNFRPEGRLQQIEKAPAALPGHDRKPDCARGE